MREMTDKTDRQSHMWIQFFMVSLKDHVWDGKGVMDKAKVERSSTLFRRAKEMRLSSWENNVKEGWNHCHFLREREKWFTFLNYLWCDRVGWVTTPFIFPFYHMYLWGLFGVCVCVSGCVCATSCMCRVRGQLLRVSSLHPPHSRCGWFLGIEFRLSGVVTSAFTHWTILLAHNSCFFCVCIYENVTHMLVGFNQCILLGTFGAHYKIC